MCRYSGKLLIIGPNYYNYLSAVENAFIRIGWNTLVESYDNPIHPYNICMKCIYKMSPDKDRLKKISRDKFNCHILNLFDRYKPDFVFIINGEILYTNTLDRFRKSSKVALWLFDNRNRIPNAIGHIGHVDALFCYDLLDVEDYREEGFDPIFLPQACDTDTYRPLDIKRDIDILFIGNIYTSPKRLDVLNKVINRFPDKTISIYGLYKPWYKGFIAWLTREHRKIYKNVNIPPTEANRMNNRAKVVLNIHQELQKNGANPRVFEICGSRAYQLCDWNPFVESIFQHGEIGIWHSVDELLSMIDDALSADMSIPARKAYEEVIHHHSFDERIKTVVDTVFGY